MTNKLIPFAGFFLLLLSVAPVQAEDFSELVSRAQTFASEGKLPQAITELNLAVQKLERQHMEKLKSFAPQSVDGMTAQKVKTGGAMGLISIERMFKGPEGQRIKFSLTGSSSSNGNAARGMGALAGFAQMANMMNANVNAETIRVKGKRGQFAEQNGKAKFTLSLGSGTMMLVEQQGGKKATKEQILAVANAADIDGLSKYLAEN